MALLIGAREQTFEEMSDRVVSDLERVLPDVEITQLEREVATELERFGDPPVRQYLTVLVFRRVREIHRVRENHR